MFDLQNSIFTHLIYQIQVKLVLKCNRQCGFDLNQIETVS